jgi:hypothetical protein
MLRSRREKAKKGKKPEENPRCANAAKWRKDETQKDETKTAAGL